MVILAVLCLEQKKLPEKYKTIKWQVAHLKTYWMESVILYVLCIEHKKLLEGYKIIKWIQYRYNTKLKQSHAIKLLYVNYMIKKF